MNSTLRRKDYPLSMRLPEADIAVIDRAAALRGRSRTDFVREAAVRAAEAALLGRRAHSHERGRVRGISDGDLGADRGAAGDGRHSEAPRAVGCIV